MKKPAAFCAAWLLGLVALAHLARLCLRIDVTIGGAELPLWVSLLAVLVPGTLAIWLWRERRQ